MSGTGERPGGDLTVRPMTLDEVGIRIDYFHDASDEHLLLLGVDRKRLPTRAAWLESYRLDYARPLPERENYLVAWLLDGKIVGFSSADRIEFGHQAFMHLHILESGLRQAGLGARFVRLSVPHYADVLQVQRLYCQPNAFNVAPNRALQRAGFRYEQTVETIPSPINFPQAVTRWVWAQGDPRRGMHGS